MDKDCFESFCTDAMLLIQVVDYAASPPAEMGEAEEGMLRQGRAVARALLVAIDQAAQRRANAAARSDLCPRGTRGPRSRCQ
jgi:hypothetical protein